MQHILCPSMELVARLCKIVSHLCVCLCLPCLKCLACCAALKNFHLQRKKEYFNRSVTYSLVVTEMLTYILENSINDFKIGPSFNFCIIESLKLDNLKVGSQVPSVHLLWT